MYVRDLRTEQFRNLKPAQVEFSENVNVFTGKNGSGKTNLLEALCTLCLGRTQRLNSTDTALTNSESDFYRLSGTVVDETRAYDVSVAYQSGRGKKISINDQAVKTSELFRHFSVVSLAPEDSEIISGPPSVRRSFLDFHLAQASVNHLDDLITYQRILAQRNSHLKQYGLDSEGTPFDEQLIKSGASITAFRAKFLQSAEGIAKRFYKSISSGSDLALFYHPSALYSSRESGALADIPTDIEQIKAVFAERLRSRQSAEIARETTLVGPHRDEIDILIRSFPARTHGSQGEWRSAAIALKLAVFEFLKSKRDRPPVLAFDEVFAELDRDRQRALVESFSDFGQLFVTTALEPPQSLADGARVFHIADGQITPA